MKKLARIISRVFNVATEGPFLIWLVSRFIFTSLGWLNVFLISLFFIYLLPLLFYLVFLKLKRISDWDISRKEERKSINIFASFSIISCLLIFYFLGEKTLIFFYLRLLTPFFTYFIITFFGRFPVIC